MFLHEFHPVKYAPSEICKAIPDDKFPFRNTICCSAGHCLLQLLLSHYLPHSSQTLWYPHRILYIRIHDKRLFSDLHRQSLCDISLQTLRAVFFHSIFPIYVNFSHKYNPVPQSIPYLHLQHLSHFFHQEALHHAAHLLQIVSPFFLSHNRSSSYSKIIFPSK